MIVGLSGRFAVSVTSMPMSDIVSLGVIPFVVGGAVVVGSSGGDSGRVGVVDVSVGAHSPGRGGGSAAGVHRAVNRVRHLNLSEFSFLRRSTLTGDNGMCAVPNVDGTGVWCGWSVGASGLVFVFVCDETVLASVRACVRHWFVNRPQRCSLSACNRRCTIQIYSKLDINITVI